jgi:hypothetical protein
VPRLPGSRAADPPRRVDPARARRHMDRSRAVPEDDPRGAAPPTAAELQQVDDALDALEADLLDDLERL